VTPQQQGRHREPTCHSKDAKMTRDITLSLRLQICPQIFSAGFLTAAPGHEGTIFDGITHDGPPADACCEAQAQRPFCSPHSYLVLTTGRPVGALRCAPARSPTCPDSCDRHPLCETSHRPKRTGMRAPFTSGGTSRSDVHGTRRNVVRRSSYNNGAARPSR
jgi:hypothetical protein